MWRLVKPKTSCSTHLPKFGPRRSPSWSISSGLVISLTKLVEYQFDVIFFDSPSPFRQSEANFAIFTYQSVFYLLHYLLNDFIILVVNLVIDVKLVLCIKANLAQKSVILESTLFANKASETEKAKLKEEEKKRKSAENKANMMILVNLVIYVFCRLPELLEIFYEYFQGSSSSGFCEAEIFCYLLKNVIEYLYMPLVSFQHLDLLQIQHALPVGTSKLLQLGKQEAVRWSWLSTVRDQTWLASWAVCWFVDKLFIGRSLLKAFLCIFKRKSFFSCHA